MTEITNPAALALLAELEAMRELRRGLKQEADARGDYSLATIHHIAEDVWSDVCRRVAKALPEILEAEHDDEFVGSPFDLPTLTEAPSLNT